ncbi:MAG: hypothetical protein PHE67_07945 [Campylobacterales bacterium]|nr:hypothetical protein [Campylobacterales bacterium]
MAISPRDVPRDAVFYELLRNALIAYAKENSLGYYGTHFASVLGYETKTADIQFLAGIQEVSARRISFDDVAVLLRKVGLHSAPVVNRLLEGTGLHCVPASATPLPNIHTFGIIHSIKSGELSKALLSALDDGEITVSEKKEIYKLLSDLNVFLSSLRETLELDGVGQDG